MFSLFSTFKKGLQKTATAISRGITGVFTGVKRWDAESFKKLENALIEADFGPAAANSIVADIKDRYQRGLISGTEDILAVAKEDLAAMLEEDLRPLNTAADGLTVILMVGVNGVGKTTTVGKLAAKYHAAGKKVMIAAADTFRAAAIPQLETWAGRAGVEIITGQEGADPSSVVYDAAMAAKSRNTDILLIDTAGRLHNKKNLMNELGKIYKTLSKAYPEAYLETLLVLDGTTGQNAILQAKSFSEAAHITGLVITKLDGTSKGGIAVAVQSELGIPVKYIGVGEQLDDLQNGFFIIQGRKNFRYGMDAVLLADFARAGTDEKVLDLGTGTGIVPVLLAARGKGAHITGLEIQERSADMAERSVAYNHLEEKINIVRGDMREAASIFGAASFDVVTCNPPYMIGGHGLTNPDPALAAARHEICGTFRDFAAVTEKLLVPHGR